VSSRQKVLQVPAKHLEQNRIKKLVAEHKKSDTVLLQWCVIVQLCSSCLFSNVFKIKDHVLWVPYNEHVSRTVRHAEPDVSNVGF
jgi:hypothetical protein